MRQTGPNLLRHTITRLWNYNNYVQKPYDSGYIFVTIFKPIYLLKVFLNIYKKSRLQHQNSKFKNKHYGRTKLYNMETGAYKFINFKMRFINGILNLFCNFRSKYEIFPNSNALITYKKINFKLNKKFKRFSYMKLPKILDVPIIKKKKFFFRNFKYKLNKNKFFASVFPPYKKYKFATWSKSQKKIKKYWTMRDKIKSNKLLLEKIVISELKNKTNIYKKKIKRSRYKYRRRLNKKKIFFFQKEKIIRTVYAKKKKANLYAIKRLYCVQPKIVVKIKKRKKYEKKPKKISVSRFWYVQLFNRLLEHVFCNFINNTVGFRYFQNNKIFLQQEFSIPRATKMLTIYKQNMVKNTYFIKKSKFYNDFLNLLPTVQNLYALDVLAKQIAIELTRTKKYWKVVRGAETLITNSYVQMRNDAIKGSAGLSGSRIIMSGCFGKNRTKTIVFQFGSITKASFFEADVLQTSAFAKADRGSFSVKLIASR